MALEVEQKFRTLSPTVFDQIRARGQVAGHPLEDPDRTTIRNTYLDTTDGVLLAHGRQLRLKEKRRAYSIMYKDQVEGNRVRREVEARITPAEARQVLGGDVTHIRSKAARAARRFVPAQRVRPILRVENAREAWHIRSDTSHIRVCLDVLGYDCLCDERTHISPVHELELELLCGDISFLGDVAQGLAREHAVVPSPESKYERGAALFGLFGSPVVVREACEFVH